MKLPRPFPASFNSRRDQKKLLFKALFDFCLLQPATHFTPIRVCGSSWQQHVNGQIRLLQFVDKCTKFPKDLPNLKHLKPFPKALVPEGNTTHDIGNSGYSSIRYLASQDKEGKVTTRICGTKGRVSKRTIPAHEALCRAFKTEETKKLAKVLSHSPEIANTELQV